MRTNIVIDDQLMRETLRATGLKTQTRGRGTRACKPCCACKKQTEIRSLRGKLEWKGDLNAIRSDPLILVDSSTWIDYFQGTVTPQTDRLDELLSQELLAIGDVILTEVLQGFQNDRDFNEARKLLDLPNGSGTGRSSRSPSKRQRTSAPSAARGITIRKTIDTLIATRCIESGFHLLHNDRDFDPFARHLGLRVVV